mmetsp:Transcript_19249/g.35981  ORF Transcript_19249/g.35981 Transcript_19249/m.35981 type:complete len:526 (+) Transcript_19249:523-2100(+)
MESERNTNDEEHHEAFGEQTNISRRIRYDINLIKNNDPNFKWFNMDDNDVEYFSDLAWELLGRYIAENNHLEDLGFDCGLTDEKMTLLFKHLTRSASLKTLDISRNNFGLDGIQSMIPFLKNSPNLTTLAASFNDNINADCFSLLVNALHDGPIEVLDIGKCSIEDITALETYSLPHLKSLDLQCNNIRIMPSLELLPHLKTLDLAKNNIGIIPSLEKCTNLQCLHLNRNSIGMQGCMSISNLLKNTSSRLRILYLDSNDIGDEEAEILADSLRHNTALTRLWLGGNKFKEVGLRAFLKLLNNVSSIEQTYKSNHTLITLGLPEFTDSKSIQMKNKIDYFLRINYRSINGPNRRSVDVGQTKVIMTQLNSNTRMEICNLQSIDYSYNSIFVEIDDVFIPHIMALVGRKHGQDELYRMIIATAPAMASIINRRAALRERIAENVARATALDSSHTRQVEAMNAQHARKVTDLTKENLRQATALTAQRLEMDRELESIVSGGGAHSVVDTNLSSVRKPRGKKRDRGK